MNFPFDRYTIDEAIEYINNVAGLPITFTIEHLLPSRQRAIDKRVNLFINDMGEEPCIKKKDYDEVWCEPLECMAFIKKNNKSDIIPSNKMLVSLNLYCERSSDGEFIDLEEVKKGDYFIFSPVCIDGYHDDLGRKLEGFSLASAPLKAIHARDAEKVEEWAKENKLELDFHYETQKSKTKVNGKWEDSTFYTFGNELQIKPDNSVFFDCLCNSLMYINPKDIFIPDFELERYIKVLQKPKKASKDVFFGLGKEASFIPNIDVKIVANEITERQMKDPVGNVLRIERLQSWGVSNGLKEDVDCKSRVFDYFSDLDRACFVVGHGRKRAYEKLKEIILYHNLDLIGKCFETMLTSINDRLNFVGDNEGEGLFIPERGNDEPIIENKKEKQGASNDNGSNLTPKKRKSVKKIVGFLYVMNETKDDDKNDNNLLHQMISLINEYYGSLPEIKELQEDLQLAGYSNVDRGTLSQYIKMATSP